MPYKNTIRDFWKKPSTARWRERLLAFLILSFVILCPACVTREEIRAHIWLNNALPADLCVSEPRLRDYGFYRRLDSGKLEFLSFCSPEALKMLAIIDSEYEELLDKTLPRERP